VRLDTRWRKTLRDVTGYRGQAVALFIALSVGIFTVSTMLGAYGIVRREVFCQLCEVHSRVRDDRGRRGHSSRPAAPPLVTATREPSRRAC
jgi:hypothetical protein